MKFKYITFASIILLLVGCASVKTEFVDPYGRQLPNPNYVLQVVGEPIMVVFYYTAYEQVKDLDGSLISKPTFLDMFQYHNLSADKYSDLTLTIEVRNPKELEYSLFEQVKFDKDGKTMFQGGNVRKSNQPYRLFMYHLPLGKSIRSASHSITMKKENTNVMQIGSFRYDFYTKGGDKVNQY